MSCNDLPLLQLPLPAAAVTVAVTLEEVLNLNPEGTFNINVPVDMLPVAASVIAGPVVEV